MDAHPVRHKAGIESHCEHGSSDISGIPGPCSLRRRLWYGRAPARLYMANAFVTRDIYRALLNQVGITESDSLESPDALIADAGANGTKQADGATPVIGSPSVTSSGTMKSRSRANTASANKGRAPRGKTSAKRTEPAVTDGAVNAFPDGQLAPTKRRRIIDSDLEDLERIVRNDIAAAWGLQGPPGARPKTRGRIMRDALVQRLIDAMRPSFDAQGGGDQLVATKRWTWARSLEAHLYDLYYIFHGELYSQMARDLCSFLCKIPDHASVLSLDPAAVCRMSLAQLYDAFLPPSVSAAPATTPYIPMLPTLAGFNRCLKCKGTNVQYSQLQTRSLDEPATIFYFCQDCKNRWKQNG